MEFESGTPGGTVLTLEDLRRRAGEIRWRDSEETLLRASEEGRLDAGPVLYVEVWGCKAVLVLAELEAGRIRSAAVHGVENRLLERAVFEAGGSLLLAGRYPVTEAIRSAVLGP